MIKQLLTVIISIGCCSFGYAQISPADTVTFEKGVVYAIDVYNKNIGEQAEIYNGPEYNFLPRATKGTPYFENRFDFTKSAIKYNGTWYGNVSILYDSYRDLLVATQPQNSAMLILHKQYVTDFLLFGHHFVRLAPVGENKQALREDYYDQLYAGKTMVICKQAKSRTETTSTQGVEVVFDDKESYYIGKGGIYYSVNSKGSVLKVFKDKKKELNTYLSRNNINYKENKGSAIAKLAAYYDQISN